MDVRSLYPLADTHIQNHPHRQGWEYHTLEKEMATHSSILAWRIPGTGEPGGLPSMGLGFQPRLGDSKHLLFKALGVGHLLRQSGLTDNVARICWGVSDGGRAGLGKPEPPREGVNPW